MTHTTHQPHVTHYRILSASDPARLSADVEHAIREGWQPFGPLSLESAIEPGKGVHVTYAQAIAMQSEWYR